MTERQLYIFLVILLLVLAAIAGAYLWKKLDRWLNARTIRKRLNRGVQKEKEAASWLERNGYKILEYQCRLDYEVRLNGIPTQIGVSPDFKVKKNGEVSYVEVKSGISAPRIENKDTRRQLLEYHYINPEVPLYLLNMEQREIKLVEFPITNNQPKKSSGDFWWGFLFGAALIAILVFWWYYN